MNTSYYINWIDDIVIDNNNPLIISSPMSPMSRVQYKYVIDGIDRANIRTVAQFFN